MNAADLMIWVMLHYANYDSALGSNVSLYPMAFTLLPFVTVLLLFDIQYVATEYLSFKAMGGYVSVGGSHALPATAITTTTLSVVMYFYRHNLSRHSQANFLCLRQLYLLWLQVFSKRLRCEESF
jgi:hypothetical protein